MKIERFGSATGAGLKAAPHSMENPTAIDRKPDERAGCAVDVGSALQANRRTRPIDEIIEDYERAGYREWTRGGSLLLTKP